jgi:hypothetical protein
MLKAWKVNRGDQNDKIIQVLAYAYMYETEAKSKPIEAGIISFKNLRFYRLISKKRKEEI